MNKLLMTIFIVALVVIVGEVGYLFYSNTLNSNLNQNLKKSGKSTNEPLISDNIIGYLKTRKKNEGQKILIKEEIDGFIKSIMYEKAGQMTVGIVDAQGYKIVNLIFPVPLVDNNRSQQKLLLNKNGVVAPITDANQFKIGKRITKTSIIDLTDSSKNSGEIVVYDN